MIKLDSSKDVIWHCNCSTQKAIRTDPGIFILSDVRLYRDSIASILKEHGKVNVIGSAASADAFERIAELHPDIVLLDASLSDSLSLAGAIRRFCEKIEIIALALNEHEQDIILYAEAGITAYVPCEATTEDFLATIYRAARGEFACPPQITRLLFRHVAALSGERTRALDNCKLTQREREIIPFIEQGMSNKQIARELDIATATIKNHVHSIMQKLQVRRRGEIPALSQQRSHSRPIVKQRHR